ncbi:hypothetical protein AMECASPLE_032440 [Ameca splendens]|uniref:Uncharacterized protein n=1 Tax=Ameca splendens TaxID=208324 RepID=A0ABV0Y6M7_9TELE
MEEDYETAVRQFYCRPPLPTLSHKSAASVQPTSSLQSAAAAAEQSTPGLQGAATEQPTSGLKSAAAAQPTSCLLNAAIIQPKSVSTSSTRRRGRRKRGALAQVIRRSRRRFSFCSRH